MAGEVLGEVVAGILRPVLGFIFREVLLHFVWEMVVLTTGYYLCRPFNRNVEPESISAAFAGSLFWAMVGIAIFHFF